AFAVQRPSAALYAAALRRPLPVLLCRAQRIPIPVGLGQLLAISQRSHERVPFDNQFLKSHSYYSC
ncbi:MAG: hypothetical protein LIO90_09805, partial [Bacteroidales bacterium]|nr:hypothetical protein [Bacteroidales bacterium]